MEIVDYAPVLVYLTLAWAWRLAFKEFKFSLHMGLLGIMIPAHVLISVLTTSNLWFNIAGVVAGILLYLTLVFFMGGKASGETLLIIPAVIALAPLPKAFPFIGLGIVLVIGASIFAMRKQMDTVKALVYETALNSGLGATLPDYSNLPDRKSVSKDQKTISVIPFMLLALVIATVWTLVG